MSIGEWLRFAQLSLLAGWLIVRYLRLTSPAVRQPEGPNPVQDRHWRRATAGLLIMMGLLAAAQLAVAVSAASSPLTPLSDVVTALLASPYGGLSLALLIASGVGAVLSWHWWPLSGWGGWTGGFLLLLACGAAALTSDPAVEAASSSSSGSIALSPTLTVSRSAAAVKNRYAGSRAPAPAGASATAAKAAGSAAREPAIEEAASDAPSLTSALPRPGDLTLGSNIGDRLVGLTLRPGTPGPNQVLVYVSPQKGPQDGGGPAISLQVQGEPVPLQACAPTCRIANVNLQGGEDAHVAIDGSSATATFHISALPASPVRNLLKRVTDRMHHLRSLRVDETWIAAAPPLEVRYQMQAPDEMSFRSSGGDETVAIGRTQFRRSDAGKPWQRMDLAEPPTVPWLMWDGLSLQSTYLAGRETVSGSDTQVAVFFALAGRSPIWFRLWVRGDDLGPSGWKCAPEATSWTIATMPLICQCPFNCPAANFSGPPIARRSSVRRPSHLPRTNGRGRPAAPPATAHAWGST